MARLVPPGTPPGAPPAPATRVQPVAYDGDAVVLLDQLALPSEVRWVSLRTPAALRAAIVEMRVRGAPAIGIAAAYGVALAARRAAAAGEPASAAAEAAARALEGARPTAVNLRWAVSRMRAAAAAAPAAPEAFAAALEAAAREIHADDARRCEAISRHGAPLLVAARSVLTHCNTGALATGGVGTALGILRAAFAAGSLARVYVGETRPHLQGARLTAWELAQDGIPCTLLADAAAAALLSRGEVGAVVVGADRISSGGDVANKIGTYALAVLAQAHAIPFYVAAPESSVDSTLARGRDAVLEERPPDELTRVGASRIAPAGVDVWNPVFDVTPSALVTAIVTERGVRRPPYDFRGASG